MALTQTSLKRHCACIKVLFALEPDSETVIREPLGHYPKKLESPVKLHH